MVIYYFIVKPFNFIYRLYNKVLGIPISSQIHVINVASSDNTVEQDFTNRRINFSPSDNNEIINPLSPILSNNNDFSFSNIVVNNKKNSNECCICLEPFGYKKTIQLNGCKHKMHYKCVKEWLENSDDCPLCRSSQNKLKKRLKIPDLPPQWERNLEFTTSPHHLPLSPQWEAHLRLRHRRYSSY